MDTRRARPTTGADRRPGMVRAPPLGGAARSAPRDRSRDQTDHPRASRPRSSSRPGLSSGSSNSAKTGPTEEAAAALPRSPGKPVLCGVADDPHAPKVVATAANLARKLAAPLILAHVTPAEVPPGVSAAADGQARLREEENEHANELIDGLLARLGARAPPSSASSPVARRKRHSRSWPASNEPSSS